MKTHRETEINKNAAQVKDLMRSFLATSEDIDPVSFLAALGTTLALSYLAYAPNPDRGVFLTVVAKSYDIVVKSLIDEQNELTPAVSQTLN